MLRTSHSFVFFVALAFLAPAFAQENFAGVEEIVVTAERRQQTVQDLAQAITALTADDLDRTNVEDIHGLQHQVPSLHVTGGLPRPTIRGIGQDVVGPATDPGFILHINGTYVTQLATALLGFHDMERVEVLPGPTGIDYGRATTGGSMNFIWKKANPNEAEFSGDAQLASHEAFRLRGVLNVPLVEGRWASRWSGSYVLAPRPYNLTDAASGLNQKLASNSLGGGGTLRHSLRWTPAEDFSADFIVQWSRDGTPGGKARILDAFPEYGLGTTVAVAGGDACSWRDAGCYGAQHPLFGGSPDYTGAAPNPADPQQFSGNRATSQHVETLWAQAILEWNIGAHTLRSVSNYQHYDYFVDHDWDGSTVEAERLQLDNRENGFAQEVTLASNYDGAFNFVAGVNAQINEARTKLPIWDYQSARDAENFYILDAFDLINVAEELVPTSTALVEALTQGAIAEAQLAVALNPATAPADAAAAGAAAATAGALAQAAFVESATAFAAVRNTLATPICGAAGDQPCTGQFPAGGGGLRGDVPYFNLDTDTETTLFGAFARFDYEITETLSATVGVRYSYTKRDWKDRSYFDVFIEPVDLDSTEIPGFGLAYFNLVNAVTAASAGTITRDNFAWYTRVGPGAFADEGGVALPNCVNDELACELADRVQELQLKKSWSSTDGLLRLEWRPADTMLFYGYVATGERHGGFNFYESEAFEPEKIVAYELGAKTEWLDNTLVANGAVFFYDYSDKFVNVSLAGGASATTENIGDARVFGAEFSVQYQPSEALRADLTVGYLDTEILDSQVSEDLRAQPGFSGSCEVAGAAGGVEGGHHGLGSCGRTRLVDLKGNTLPRAPELTVAVSAEYGIELAGGAKLTPRVEFSWRDEVNLWQYGNPLDVQESYTNTNLRLRYAPASESWYAELFVENAEDEDAVRTNPEARAAHPQYWLAEPRLYGVRVGWSFAELPW